MTTGRINQVAYKSQSCPDIAVSHVDLFIFFARILVMALNHASWSITETSHWLVQGTFSVLPKVEPCSHFEQQYRVDLKQVNFQPHIRPNSIQNPKIRGLLLHTDSCYWILCFSTIFWTSKALLPVS